MKHPLKAAIFYQYITPISFGAFCKTVRVNDNSSINKQFIQLYFQSKYYREQISASSVGANINNVKTEDIDNLNINIPDLSVQEEAVINLTNIIMALKSKKDQLSALEELIKSRFIEMFINAGFEKKQIRHFVDTKKISAKKQYSTEDIIRYIDISSINNKSNLITGYTNHVFGEAPSRAQQCLKINDILISTVRPNLRNIAIFLDEGENYVESSGFCVLRASKCNPQYLKYVVLF